MDICFSHDVQEPALSVSSNPNQSSMFRDPSLPLALRLFLPAHSRRPVMFPVGSVNRSTCSYHVYSMLSLLFGSPLGQYRAQPALSSLFSFGSRNACFLWLRRKQLRDRLVAGNPMLDIETTETQLLFPLPASDCFPRLLPPALSPVRSIVHRNRCWVFTTIGAGDKESWERSSLYMKPEILPL